MVFSIILFVLAAFSIFVGVLGIVRKSVDKSKIGKYTEDSIKKQSLISNIFYIVSAVFMILTGLAFEELVLPIIPYYYIGWVGIIVSLLVDGLLEYFVLKKIDDNNK